MSTTEASAPTPRIRRISAALVGGWQFAILPSIFAQLLKASHSPLAAVVVLLFLAWGLRSGWSESAELGPWSREDARALMVWWILIVATVGLIGATLHPPFGATALALDVVFVLGAGYAFHRTRER